MATKRFRSKALSTPNKSVTQQLIASIKEMISGGQLVPGGKLPAERELAKHFGVNRATQPQVLKVLEIM